MKDGVYPDAHGGHTLPTGSYRSLTCEIRLGSFEACDSYHGIGVEGSVVEYSSVQLLVMRYFGISTRSFPQKSALHS